jgi:hypothetical protein
MLKVLVALLTEEIRSPLSPVGHALEQCKAKRWTAVFRY